MRSLTPPLALGVWIGLIVLISTGCTARLSAGPAEERGTTGAYHRQPPLPQAPAATPLAGPSAAGPSPSALLSAGLSPAAQRSSPATGRSPDTPTALVQGLPTAGGEGPEMPLERLIQIALDNHPSLRSAQAAREGASARLGTAQAAYFPTISTTLSYSRSTSNFAGGVSPVTGAPIPRSVSDSSINNQSFTATLRQNLFDSFRREGRVEAAREDLRAVAFDLSTTRQNVILNVRQAYYIHLLALRLVQVNEEAVARNVQNLQRAQGFFEVGTRPKIDLTRAQVDLANAKLALVQARNQAATTLAALNNAIGVPSYPPYRLVEELDIPSTMAAFEDSVRAALANRAEIQAAQARVRVTEANLKVAQRNFFPILNANASWSYSGQEFPLAPNWTAGVLLEVPALDPPRFAQLNEATANLAAARASEETVKHSVILEVQQTYADLVSARESIEAANVLVQQARENLVLAQGRYEVGVGPLIDVTDAQLAFTQAESQDIQARVNFKRAEARLRKATGVVE